MQPRPVPAIAVHRRREADGRPIDDRRLRTQVESGELVRVVPGSFVRGADWRALSTMDRHLVFVVEAVDRIDGSLTVVGAAAAAVWGIDRVGEWPRRVETVVERMGGGRSSGLFQRRTRFDIDVETVPWRGHRLTTPAQTASDLARTGTALDGLVGMDQTLWSRRPGGALSSFEDLARALSASRGPGADRIERALGESSHLSDSVRESQSRYLLARLGFPRPVLQRRFDLPGGRVAYSDFYFEAHDHIGEFDGTGKYFDPTLLGGRTPQQVLLAEKDRGDELRRCVRGLSRWRTPALDDPRRLWDILTADGLPSSRPRPPAALVLR